MLDLWLIKKIIRLVLLIFILSAAFLVWSGYSEYKKVTEEINIEEKVEKIRSKETYTPYDQLPEMYINAVIATEDHRFNQHNGLDIIALIRASVNNIKEKTFAEGGSTITQQLAKNMYFDGGKNFKRKFAEMFVAFDLEKLYSKKEILEIYVNNIYFGENCYDVKSASKYYFNAEPKNMNDFQSTMLAGIPNAPSLYNPKESEELATRRQQQVLEKMVKHKYLTEKEAEKILNDTVDIEVKNRLDDFFDSLKQTAKKTVANILTQ